MVTFSDQEATIPFSNTIDSLFFNHLTKQLSPTELNKNETNGIP